MPFRKVKDPIAPQELALLQSAFDKLCADHGLPRDDADAEALGLILLHQLQNGNKSFEELLSTGATVIRENEPVL